MFKICQKFTMVNSSLDRERDRTLLSICRIYMYILFMRLFTGAGTSLACKNPFYFRAHIMRRSCLSFPATTRAFATASPLSSDSSVKGKLKTIKEVPGPPARYQIPHIGFAFHLKPFGE